MFLKRSSFLLKIILVLFLSILFLEGIYRLSLKVISYVKYNKYSQFHNICMVGGSTACGVPFQEKVSIPILVSLSFNNCINNKNINVINLAESGMPISTAYWRTRELVMGLDNGTMLLYTGINDPFLNHKDKNIGFFYLSNKIWVLARIKYLINPWNTSKQKYEYYYEEIIKMLNKHHWTIISSTLVGNYSEFSPNISIYDIKKNRIEKFNQNNVAELGITDLKGMIKNDSPMFAYLTGKSFILNNKIDSANTCFLNAVDMDYSIRPSSYKNDFIKTISKKHNVTYIDPFSYFLELSDSILPGYNLFMDAHHPTLFGYVEIANLFSEKIAEKNSIKNHKPLTINKVYEQLKIDEQFYNNVYLESAKWHILESFYSQYYFDRLNKSSYYFSKIIVKSKDYYYWQSIYYILSQKFEFFEILYKNQHANMNFNYPISKVSNFTRIEENLNKGVSEKLLSEKIAKEYLKKLN